MLAEKAGTTMDQYGQLPLSLQAFQARLQAGQVYRIADGATETFPYALFLDAAGLFVLQQGEQTQSFRSLEVAALALLDCLGIFSQERKRGNP